MRLASLAPRGDTAPVASQTWSADRLADELTWLGARALAPEAYFEEVSARLQHAVPSQANCWHTLDPETCLLTSEAPEELIASGIFSPETAPAAGQMIVHSEYIVDDVNTFATLARRRTTVGILTETTRGQPERSARYRDLLAPSGIPYEMRAAFVVRGRAWGAVHMARSGDGPDFGARDAAVLGRVTTIIADGIRASLRHDAGRRATSDGRGLVMLGPADEVELITPPARPQLAALRSPTSSETSDTPPTSLLALAAFARAGTSARIEPIVVPSALGWISMHASRPEGINHARVAIVLDMAAGPRVAALRLEAHGVTPRERQIAALLAQGRSNGEIATALVLSPCTVQDHIKSLFDKTAVASRRELVARIFLDDHLPQIALGSPLTADGTFAAGTHARGAQ
jgi:DNA-binding CsgD family transcriptional regulator